jgi:hypothetical protein
MVVVPGASLGDLQNWQLCSKVVWVLLYLVLKNTIKSFYTQAWGFVQRGGEIYLNLGCSHIVTEDTNENTNKTN